MTSVRLTPKAKHSGRYNDPQFLSAQLSAVYSCLQCILAPALFLDHPCHIRHVSVRLVTAQAVLSSLTWNMQWWECPGGLALWKSKLNDRFQQRRSKLVRII